MKKYAVLGQAHISLIFPHCAILPYLINQNDPEMYGQDYSEGHVPQDETPLELSEGYQTNRQVTAYTGSSGIVDPGTGVYYDSNVSAYTPGFIAPSQEQIYPDVPSTRSFDDIYTQSPQTGPRYTAHTPLAYGQEVPPFHDPNGPPRHHDHSWRSVNADGFAAPFNAYPNPDPPTGGYHSSYTGNRLFPTDTTRTDRSYAPTYYSSVLVPASATQPQHVQGWGDQSPHLGVPTDTNQAVGWSPSSPSQFPLPFTQLPSGGHPSLRSYDDISSRSSRSYRNISSQSSPLSGTGSRAHRVRKSRSDSRDSNPASKPLSNEAQERWAKSYIGRRQKPKHDVGDRDTVLSNFSSQLSADRKYGNAEPRKLRTTIEEGAPDERLKYLEFLPRYCKKATGAWCWRPEKAAYIGTQLSAERELCPFCFQNDGNLYAKSTYDDPTPCDCDITNPFKTTNEIWS